MTWHAGIFSLDGDSSCGWGWEVVGGEVLLHFFSISSFSLLRQLVSSSGFSAEHLALRRSRGSVTFDELIRLWLTPLLSHCLIFSLFLFHSPSLVCSLSKPRSPSFWPLLFAQDSGCWINWIVLNSGSLLQLLWSSRRLFDSGFLWSSAL